MAYPNEFAAIAPVCGGSMAWNAKMLTMPVWAFHGVDDNAVSVTQSDEMVAAIRKREGDVTYTRMEGVGHNVWEHAYNDRLYDWFMSKKRGEK
jgi:predicted peptidase